MQGVHDDDVWVRLSRSPSGDIPASIQDAKMRLLKPLTYSNKHGSILYSAQTETGEHWIIRSDWFEVPPDSEAT